MDYSALETTARVREWQYLTGEDFRQMDRARTVVMVSCSPLEVHGPHLPVVTDNLEAEAIALRTMELLNERHPELEFVHLPPLYTAADVLPHHGSVMFRSSTIQRVLEDLGRTLGKQGFRHIWVSSFHGGPRHFVPIEVAADRSNRRYGTRMVSCFSLLVNRLTGGGSELSTLLGRLPGLTPEVLEGDAHGGAIETSLMLHLLGRHVRASYRDLGRTTVNLELEKQGKKKLEHGRVTALLRGFKHKLAFYENATYSGTPSLATPELGRQMLDVLASHAADALSDVYFERLPLEQCHSPVWPVRWLFTSDWVGRAFERAMGYQNRVF